MAHTHATYAANEWMQELIKKRQPIPGWMMGVLASIMKPDIDPETRERKTMNANVVQCW